MAQNGSQCARRTRHNTPLGTLLCALSFFISGELLAQAGEDFSTPPTAEITKTPKNAVRRDIFTRVPTEIPAPAPDTRIPKSEQDAAREVGVLPKEPDVAATPGATLATPVQEALESARKETSGARKARTAPTPPPPEDRALEDVIVENVIGKPSKIAVPLLEKRRLVAKQQWITSTERPGYVVDQNPKSGTAVPPSSTVTIIVSNGKGNDTFSGQTAKIVRPDPRAFGGMNVTALLGGGLALLGFVGWGIRKAVSHSASKPAVMPPPAISMKPGLNHMPPGLTISEVAITGPTIHLRATIQHRAGPTLHLGREGEH